MSELENLKNELKQIHDEGDAWHGPSLKKTLSDVTAQEAAARLVSGGHSIWELVLHIAAWEDVFRRRLDGELLTEPAEGDFPAVREQEWKAALTQLDTAHTKLIERIATLKEADLVRKIEGKDYSVAYMLHGLVRHHVYHAGQIGILKRLLRK